MPKLDLETRIKNQQKKIKDEELKLEKMQIERDKKILKIIRKYKIDSAEKLDGIFQKLIQQNSELKKIYKICQSDQNDIDSVEKLHAFVAQLLSEKRGDKSSARSI